MFKQNNGSTCGGLYHNCFILNDNTVTKLIYINKLTLPDVLIDIIKDYLYYSCEVAFHRMLTRRIVKNVDGLRIDTWCMKGESDNIEYEWEMEYYLNRVFGQCEPTFKYYFCSQCGNYTNDNLYDDENYSYNVLCYCSNHPYYQYHEDTQKFMSILMSSSSS